MTGLGFAEIYPKVVGIHIRIFDVRGNELESFDVTPCDHNLKPIQFEKNGTSSVKELCLKITFTREIVEYEE